MKLVRVTEADWIDLEAVQYLEDLGKNITRIGFTGGQNIRVHASTAALARLIEDTAP